jgi:hypothetical protein
MCSNLFPVKNVMFRIQSLISKSEIIHQRINKKTCEETIHYNSSPNVMEDFTFQLYRPTRLELKRFAADIFLSPSRRREAPARVLIPPGYLHPGKRKH